MTRLLEKMIEEASKLPEREQDALAKLFLEEMESERRWEDRLASSMDELEALADEALAEHRAGKTKILDPETL